MLSVGGQNIFPEDVEIVVNSLPGIYPGRAVAFGILNAHDTESLIVVAEMRGRYDREQAAFMEKEIAQLVLTSVGLAPGRVCVTPERWIVKSTAGRIFPELKPVHVICASQARLPKPSRLCGDKVEWI